MPAEETQERGRDGVLIIRRWLESTTYLDLSFNCYANPALCEIQHMGEAPKEFDLAGFFLLDPLKPVSVECKRYSSPGHQAKEFETFLAISYGAALRRMKNKQRDEERQFVWATSHPFALTKWSKLTDINELRTAVSNNQDVAGKEPFDEDLGRKVIERIWILVWNEKQEKLSLSTEEVLSVWQVLKRRKDGL